MIDIAVLRAAGLSNEQAIRVLEAAQRSPRRLHEKDLSGPCFVYCLIDPKKRRVFYVGISKYQFYRFEQHRTDPGSCAYHIVNRLLQDGYHPNQIYKIFKQCADRQSALDVEFNLINSAPGLVNKNRQHQTVSA